MPNVRSRLASAARIGDLQEYRLDLSSDWDADTFSHFPASAILTARDSALTPDLLRLMTQSKAFVDLDIEDYRRFPDVVPSSRLILSIHLAAFDEDRIRDFLALRIAAVYYKVIFHCEQFLDILKTRKIIQDSKRDNVLFNVMGRWDILQRSMYEDFGSIGYYAAHEDVLVKEQAPDSAISPIRAKPRDRHTKLFAIVGDSNVNSSLSLRRYNEFFAASRTNAIFLPIPAQDVDELLLALRFFFERYRPGGLVITSPFKKILAEYFNSELCAINSVRFDSCSLPDNHYHFDLGLYVACANTDLDALDQSMKVLGIGTHDTIAIYGSGACAEIFARHLIAKGYTQLWIFARNPRKSYLLNLKLKLDPFPKRDKYKLLINASFTGQSGHYFHECHLPYESLIDLPYNANGMPCSMILDAISAGIPFVDGHLFWLYQFAHQRVFLLPESPPC